MNKILKKCDPDEIIADIRTHKDTQCPKCGKVLLYQANSDLSRIYSIYCANCEFRIKMTYKMI